jgi:pyrimidine operon attenuation protein / uracil phosphoribosyltransferase
MAANIILHPGEIEHKIKRIAYQIYETFVEEEQVVIAGISKNGYVIAEKIAEVVREISPLRVTLCEVFINKQNPFEAVTTSIPAEEYRDKGLVLVDDVLHSGSTLIYGIKHFLDVPLKKFKTAVLVDRNHKKFPVKVDFKGISLSTSLQEHVEVLVENRELTALLH